MKVDFHVHSTASDGSYRPDAIARMTDGFSYAALTDHDTCEGAAAFLGEPHSGGSCRRVAGIELSIDPGEGFDMFHLLGLGIDPDDAGLREFRQRILAAREARNAAIFENFAKRGILLENDLRVERKDKILARPHFAKWLVRHRFAESVRDAFAKYLLPESPAETNCYVEGWHPAQEEAFAVVHAAGGVCMMAHPKFWRSEWKVSGCDFSTAEKNLVALKEKGLDGIEAVYQANSPGENAVFTDIADRHGFLKSAGSDFHGSNKPTVTIGMEVDESFIRPLTERLDIRFPEAKA